MLNETIKRLGEQFFGHKASTISHRSSKSCHYSWWVGNYKAPNADAPIPVIEENQKERVALAKELAGKFKDYLLDHNITNEVVGDFTFIRVNI